jgi:hypothetical protein
MFAASEEELICLELVTYCKCISDNRRVEACSYCRNVKGKIGTSKKRLRINNLM